MAGATGEVIIDFGTGADRVDVAVSRASVAAATTHVEAYLFPKSTGSGLNDHSVEDHLLDGPVVNAHSIIDGVGFTITAMTPPWQRSSNPCPDYLSGRFTVRWVSTE